MPSAVERIVKETVPGIVILVCARRIGVDGRTGKPVGGLLLDRGLGKRLLDEGLATEEELEGVDGEVEREIEDAVTFAEESPFPEQEALYEDVFVQ